VSRRARETNCLATPQSHSLARGKIYISWSRCFARNARENCSTHHQSTILHTTAYHIWKASPALTKFLDRKPQIPKFYLRTLSMKVVRLPRGNDKKTFYKKRYHDVWLLVIQCCCSAFAWLAHTTLFSSLITRMHHFSHLVSRDQNGQRTRTSAE
jgi:hypothetical protein